MPNFFGFDLNKVAEFRHTSKDSISFFGQEVFSLSITGPLDKDKDGFPEFHVNLDFLGGEVFEEDIELDASVVFPLLRAVVGGIVGKGKTLPPMFLNFVGLGPK